MSKLSDIAFERYEALFEKELYRQKDIPMYASEHEKMARKKVYEAVIAECSKGASEASPSLPMWLVKFDGEPHAAYPGALQAETYASGFSSKDKVEIVAGAFIDSHSYVPHSEGKDG